MTEQAPIRPMKIINLTNLDTPQNTDIVRIISEHSHYHEEESLVKNVFKIIRQYEIKKNEVEEWKEICAKERYEYRETIEGLRNRILELKKGQTLVQEFFKHFNNK